MVNETLVREIRARLKEGHDLVEQREELLRLGYSEREVHDAIDLVIGELSGSGKKEQEKPKKFDYLSFSFSRIILPLILLILLAISIFYNYNNISSISMDRCKVAQLNAQIEQLNVSENIELVKKDILPMQMNIWAIDRENFDMTRKTILANLPIDFIHIGWINPLFPFPCEKVSLAQHSNCRFYSDKQSYDCLKEHNDNAFLPTTIDYNSISGLALLINLIIIIIEAFVLNSILVILWKLIKEHTTKKAKQVIETIIILAIVIVITAIIYGIFQSLKAITS